MTDSASTLPSSNTPVSKTRSTSEALSVALRNRAESARGASDFARELESRRDRDRAEAKAFTSDPHGWVGSSNDNAAELDAASSVAIDSPTSNSQTIATQAGSTSAGVALSVSRELAGQVSVADRAAAELRTSTPVENETSTAPPKPGATGPHPTPPMSAPVPVESGLETNQATSDSDAQPRATPATPDAKSVPTSPQPAATTQAATKAAPTTAAAIPSAPQSQPSPTAVSAATAAPVAGSRSAPTAQVDLGGAGAGRTGIARAATKPNAPTTPDAKEVISKATQGLAAAIRQKGGSVVLKLEPESLGQLRITVSMRNGVVNAKIEAGTSEAAELLKTHQGALRESMHEKGMLVERLEIVDASHTAKELAPDLRTDRLVHLPFPDLSRSSDDTSHGSTSNDTGGQHQNAFRQDGSTNDPQYASREDQSSPDDAWRHASGADHAIDSLGARSLINTLA